MVDKYKHASSIKIDTYLVDRRDCWFIDYFDRWFEVRWFWFACSSLLLPQLCSSKRFSRATNSYENTLEETEGLTLIKNKTWQYKQYRNNIFIDKNSSVSYTLMWQVTLSFYTRSIKIKMLILTKSTFN